MFGEFVKERRLALGLSLRKFCKLLDLDPSNWSKIERGIHLPPQDKEFLAMIAEAVNIKADSSEWDQLLDYASVDRGEIPTYLLQNKEMVKLLPAFFRTVGSVKPTKEEVVELLEKLKGANR